MFRNVLLEVIVFTCIFCSTFLLCPSFAFTGIQFSNYCNCNSFKKAFISSATKSVVMPLNLSSGDLEDVEILEFSDLVEVGTAAAKAAGDIILNYKGGADVKKTKFNAKDLLTEVDPMCEEKIREVILNSFPSHSILGEEDVEPGKDASARALELYLTESKSDYLWIVDPIDGTSNFVHGMPLSMPSIACAYKGEVVAGIIYDPHRDELFTATLGGGSFMNGEKINVGDQDNIGDAIVAMGSPPAAESMEMSLRGIKYLMPKVRTIRMLGSAAIMLAWVANGRLTAYWEWDLSAWDIAAGALLVKEAGGKFTDVEGKDYELRTRQTVASNGKVHQAILDTLHEAGVQ